MLRNPFVVLVLMFAAVAAFLKFFPGDWLITSDQRRLDDIVDAIENMDGVDVAQMIGMASGISELCGYQLQRESADIALHNKNFEMSDIEVGGFLHTSYVMGFNMAGGINCEKVMAGFGDNGNIIPTLLIED